jgi:putative ABC transport system permease protein
MFKNFFILAFRKLWKNKLFTIINVVGLFMGMTSFFFVWMYVQYEKSFDQFRSHDIYRIAGYRYQDKAEVSKSAQISPAISPAIVRDIPEVEHAARLVHTSPFMAEPVIQIDGESFREDKIYYADSSFMKMFSYRMYAGSVNEALSKPFQAAISRSLARKYFHDENVIGKVLQFHRGTRGMIELKVAGVFEDLPSNSHFQTDILISFSTFRVPLDDNWDWDNFYTYIQLEPGTNPADVEKKMPAFLNTYIKEKIAADATAGLSMRLVLQPIQAIHLDSKLWAEISINGDRRTVNFLATIAIIILVIAYVNYINFSIAKSAESIREMGIRKISGSNQAQLVGQLVAESSVINCIAEILSIIAVIVALPYLKELLDLPAGMEPVRQDWWNALFLFIAGILLSGLYPAYAVSTLKPSSILKSKVSRSPFQIALNRSLVVFQFTGSIALIISTLTIYRQLSYIKSHETGFNLTQTLVVKGPAIKDSTYFKHQDFFYNQVKQLPGISSMAISSSVPGQDVLWGRQFSRTDKAEKPLGVGIVAVDENFLRLFGAAFAAGENFPDGTISDRDAVIFNETAVKLLGYSSSSDPIGQTIIWHEDDSRRPVRVIGVVKDFNQRSLRNEIGPIVFALKKYLVAPWAGEYYTFKIATNEYVRTVNDIDKVWHEVFPGNPFDYFFLEEYFSQQYRSEQTLGRLFILFTIVAVAIGCLGLFGLSTYMTILRVKEIGIRKALGATNFEIMGLLSIDFLVWVILAFLLACPITFYIMNEWLRQFAYRADLSVWTFLLSGFACCIIALISVAWKSWEAANINPSKALKYE